MELEESLGFSILMEHEESEMIDSYSSNPSTFTRLAHFLTPTSPQPSSPPPNIIPCRRGFPVRSLASMFQFRDYFQGDRCWKRWARKLHSEYEMKWKEAGIYEAIGCSGYDILTDNDVIIAVAEKWCSETNTFKFPWGEATVTLEDVNVLGGFSVSGDYVNAHLHEITDSEQVLNEAFWDICGRDCHVPRCRQWMDRFEGQLYEHEAFITLWLSMFVFPNLMCDAVNKKVIPIAVRLAEGYRVALAPAVLAGIYQALTNVKNMMLKLREGRISKIYEPLYFVQLWVWERFIMLRPEPNLLNRADVPRVALWRKVRRFGRNLNVRLALDTAGESFIWRPYMLSCNGWLIHPLFKDEDQWFSTDSVSGHVGRDIESFARCLRVCDIVGFCGFVEKYLPNRVAMQFGFDQDVPGYIHLDTLSQEDAWRNYSKPLVNTLIYIPSKNINPCVTKKYLDWWRKSIMPQLDQIRGVVRRPRSFRNTRKRCYGNESHDMDSMYWDGLTPKQALYYTEWSKKAQLLRQEPEEIDEGAAAMLLNQNATILDEVQQGICFDKRVVPRNIDFSINADEVAKARIKELEAVNKKLVDRVTELEILVEILRSEFVLRKAINRV